MASLVRCLLAPCVGFTLSSRLFAAHSPPHTSELHLSSRGSLLLHCAARAAPCKAAFLALPHLVSGRRQTYVRSKMPKQDVKTVKGESGSPRRKLNDTAERTAARGQQEQERRQHELLPPSECSSTTDTATAAANGDNGEAAETATAVKEAVACKKKRGAPNCKASAGGPAKKAAKASESEPLVPDEEFSALAAVAAKSRKFVGAHISAAGGVHNALLHCLQVKGQAFALFLKCQRKWVSPPLAPEAISGFKERCDQLKMEKTTQILPHGSYLINVANPDKAKQENAYKALLDDLRRCEQLGIQLYNLHPGSTVGDCSSEEGIKNIAAAVNRAHKDTSYVIVVLENMAGQKNVVGSKFEDLRDIIKLVENKERVGVCLDTCHLFAAGYDIRTAEKFEKVMDQFDSVVGYKYLKGMHLNDSKSDLGSGLDRHELLGKGKLGLEPFKYIVRHPTLFKDMPLILETPDPTEGTIWKQEIKQLYSFLEKETK
ncbi:hypothetical protein Efla_000355 [Eimeria flavescens]